MKFGADYYTCVWEITYMDFGIKKKRNKMNLCILDFFRNIQDFVGKVL